MNEYERRLEEARLARRGESFLPERPLRKNRIEAALGAPVYTDTAPRASSYGRFLKRFFFTLVTLIVLVAVGYGGYTAFDNYRHPKLGTTTEVVQAVSKLVALPAETPTVATVSDLTPLEGQPFFKDARVGDKVLIFSAAKKAILYRPLQNKIINAAALSE